MHVVIVGNTPFQVWAGKEDYEFIRNLAFDFANEVNKFIEDNPEFSDEDRALGEIAKHFRELTGNHRMYPEVFRFDDSKFEVERLAELCTRAMTIRYGNPNYAIMEKSKPEISSIHSAEMYFDWSWDGCGFGQLSFERDRTSGKWSCMNEMMGPKSVRKILHAMADHIADNLEGPINEEREEDNRRWEIRQEERKVKMANQTESGGVN